MANHEGDYRPPSAWEGLLRTACHACRGTGYTTVQDDDSSMRTRSVVLSGDGQVVKAIGTASGMDELVSVPCPVCGESETPGWLPGFVPPA